MEQYGRCVSVRRQVMDAASSRQGRPYKKWAFGAAMPRAAEIGHEAVTIKRVACILISVSCPEATTI